MRLILLWVFGFYSIAFAASYEEGRGVAALEVSRAQGSLKDTSLLKSKGVPISENPPQISFYNKDNLQRAADQEKRSNQDLKRIYTSQKDRRDYNPDLDSVLQRALENEEVEEVGVESSFRKTCRRSGMSYTRTCKRERIVNIEVIPEIRKRNPRFCLGHWKNWGTSKSYCGGCKGGDEYIERHKAVNILRDEWVGCEPEESLRDSGAAELEDLGPGPIENPRLIQGEPVGGDIWEEIRIYRIGGQPFDQCSSLRVLGCVDKGGRCIQSKTLEDGQFICLEYEHTYDCPTGKSKTRLSKNLKVSAMESPSYAGNKNMAESLARIEALKQASQSLERGYFGNNVVSIFRGRSKRCTTNFGGSFKDCCKRTGGIGVNLRLATGCSAEETELAEWRKQGRCVFVDQHQKIGTFGMNISKEYIYCCFPTKLARAIQQGGRGQLGLGWGNAETPDCRGFTPSELQRINFSTLDLSEIFEEISQSAQLATQTLQRDYAQKQRSLESTMEMKKRQLTQEKAQNPKGKSYDPTL